MPVASAGDMLIRSAQGDYPVHFVSSIEDLIAAIPKNIAPDNTIPQNAIILTDRVIQELHPEVIASFRDRPIFSLKATEEEKTLDGVEKVCRFLQDSGASKQSRLIVIGGGILQDIGAFAAHVYYRGIPFDYIPTTLLSMADSCIGAKCGVNLGHFKNQLGFFQAPKSVTIYPEFLRTLPPGDIRSGFGEILKLAIIAGEKHYTWFEERIRKQGFALEGVTECIVLGLQTKKPIIEADEYERNVRKTLNYGHTFGHALETITNNEVPHGLAVAWGVDVANYVAWQTGMFSERQFNRIHDFIAEYFPLPNIRPFAAGELVAAMARDKKTTGGTVQLILPSGFGKLHVVPTARDEYLAKLICDYISQY